MSVHAASLLVVDDDPLFAGLTTRALRAAGYTVRTATSAAEARAQLDGFRPDLAVLDLDLGDGVPDGVETARLLSGYGVPALFQTARTDAASQARLLSVPHEGVVAKLPGNEPILAVNVAAALARLRRKSPGKPGEPDAPGNGEAQAALRLAKERYDLLMSTTDDVLWTMDLDFRTTYMSPSVQRQLGYPVAEYLALPFERRLPPEALPIMQAVVGRFRAALAAGAGPADGCPQLFEMPHLHRDGRIIWGEVSARLLFDEGGKPIGIVGVTRDVTPRRRAEQALRDAVVRYELLLASADDIIWTIGPDLRVDWVSPALTRKLGLDPADWLGEGFMRSMHPDAHPTIFAVTARLRQVLEEHPERAAGFHERFEVPVLHRDGHVLWGEIDLSFIVDAHGRPVGLIGASRDITERRRAERALVDALAEKELLLRELSHRVKNNLALVSSLLAMEADKLADPAAREVFADAQARLSTLALLYQRLGPVVDGSAVTGCDFLLDCARAFFAAGNPRPGSVRLETAKTSAGPCAIESRRAITVGMLLHELLANALKHAFRDETPGLVHVAVVCDGARISLEVADDGAGLPAGFDVASAGSTGLELARLLAEQLGGALSGGNRAAGGAVFRVEFPVGPAA